MVYSYLDLVKKTDSVPYRGEFAYKEVVEPCYLLLAHDGVAIGRVLPFVVSHLEGFGPVLKVDHGRRTIKFSPAMDSVSSRSEMIRRIITEWRRNKTFKVLEAWRDELYAVYHPDHNVYLLIERAAAAIFGFVTYGIHLIGYVPGETPDDIKIWVPRRAKTKPTFPGMLDNTVAGGIGYPYGINETVVKECYEEAGLSEEYVVKNAIPTGVISYEHQSETTIESEAGFFQPEVEYIFDLKMGPEVQPKVVDGEVESFKLMTLPEVKEALKNGEFKYNTAMVTIDFMIRWGYISADTERDYLEIVQRCHRKLDFPII